MTQETNPLLAKARIPGETHTLPSRGLFYKNGEISSDVVDGEITISPLTTICELNLKSPDLLFSGKAITEVFKICIPQILKPLELLAKDVDFLLTCLRKVTYGEFLDVDNTHTCENAKRHTYQVSLSPFINDAKRIDPTSVNDTYQITLDNGQKLKLTPPRFINVLRIYRAAGDDDADVESVKTDVIDTILGMIESVDGVSDRDMVSEWLNTINVSYIHKISGSVDSVSNWGAEFDTTITCKDCNEEVGVEIPLNPILFFI